MKRIYKNKNFWMEKFREESCKLQSEKLKEIIEDKRWILLSKEITSIYKIFDKINPEILKYHHKLK